MIYSTNNFTFVYCFSKVLAVNDQQYDISLDLFFKSVRLSSLLYKVKVYTDRETIDDLKSLGVELVCLENLDLIFLDDFKIYCLQHLNNDEILVDTDVLIYKNLSIDRNRDIIFDFKDHPYSRWYTQSFKDIPQIDLRKELHSIYVPEFIPNIGFLQINNSYLLERYLNLYMYYRSKIIDCYPDNNRLRQFSMIIGQYVLGVVLSEGKYSYFNISSKNTKSTYEHLSGPVKFRKTQII